jgi:aminopeptidase N
MVAARIVTPLTHWRRYGEERGALMRAELESLTRGEPLSENLRECVEKGLA